MLATKELKNKKRMARKTKIGNPPRKSDKKKSTLKINENRKTQMNKKSLTLLFNPTMSQEIISPKCTIIHSWHLCGLTKSSFPKVSYNK